MPAQNSTTHTLTPEEQAQFHDLLSRGGMDEKNRKILLDELHKTGELRIFGYGSLISNPAFETDKSYGGKVSGWEKGAFSKGRHFRGTPENLGVTLGALPAEGPGKSLPGVVQVVGSEEINAMPFGARVLNSIRLFVARETSLNPIYSYQMVDVETVRHGTVKAIIS